MIQGVVLLIAFVAIVAGFVLYFSSETLVASRAGRLAMLLGVALLPGAALLGGASYAYQASSTTEFCLSCHEMDAHGQSLFVDDPTVLPAVHYQKRLIDRDHACFVCHTDYAMFGDLEAKMNGLKHVWVHYLGEASDPLDLYSPYPNANCLHCHDDARSFLEASVQEDGEIPTSCARCHSREGFRDYIGDDASEVGVVNQAAPIGSVVDCDTCHNDAAGSLDWVTFPSGVSVDELGAEARCMTCHQGRGSTDSVDALIMQAGVADDEVSDVLTFQNIHYFPVAATLFAGVARGGYQYEEQVYDRRFRHVPEYNSCTDCHDPHTTQPRFDGCATCHSAVTSAAEVRDIRMIASRNVDYDGDGDTEVGIYHEIEGLKESTRWRARTPVRTCTTGATSSSSCTTRSRISTA